MSDNTQFYNKTLRRYIKFDEVVKEIINYIQREPEMEYKISVGTDSRGSKNTQLVSAIAILKVGNGGRYFWTKSQKIFCPTLQNRIYKETMQSIVLTQELRGRLKDCLGEEFFWDDKISVHLDVGKNGATRDLIESVVGMVKGFGLVPIIKPDSFSAFVLADRHT
jgi:predicted RNase H-related nuclease YkuK (DUF458 family)